MRMTPWRVMIAVIDAACVTVAMMLGAVSFNNGRVPAEVWEAGGSISLTVLLLVVTNFLTGLYNRIWEYASAETALSIGMGVTVAAVGGMLLSRALVGPLPVAIWYLTWLTSLVTVGGTRLAWRMIRPLLQKGEKPTKRILIYGAGHEGCALPRSGSAERQQP